MDNQLLNLIHNYTEDREIDWTSAKVIGEQYGKVFKTEDDLREWKYLIDSYLKTFRAEDFQKVEEACKKKVNKKKDDRRLSESRENKSREKSLGLYTRAHLEKLKKYYKTNDVEKALEKAIKDKERGIDVKKKVLGTKPNDKNESRRKRGRNSLGSMLN